MLINVFGIWLNPDRIIFLEDTGLCTWITFDCQQAKNIEGKTEDEVANKINEEIYNYNPPRYVYLNELNNNLNDES